jgi:glucosamine-6-phosphate deaminase
MKIIKANDHTDMSKKAANIISAQVILNEESVLGLATGSTVIGIYNQLIEWYEKSDLSFKNTHTVNLDEYIGLAPSNEQSYRYFMNANLFSKIDIPIENTFLPDGMALDLEKECERYDNLIEDLGGIDLMLLGLGLNGHIGFNEPNDSFEKKTHCVSLSESTMKANARFFKKEQKSPHMAITIGINNIMQAKRIVLCVSGKHKSDILEKVLFGRVTSEVPGSILQIHSNLTVVADAEALQNIE